MTATVVAIIILFVVNYLITLKKDADERQYSKEHNDEYYNDSQGRWRYTATGKICPNPPGSYRGIEDMRRRRKAMIDDGIYQLAMEDAKLAVEALTENPPKNGYDNLTEEELAYLNRFRSICSWEHSWEYAVQMLDERGIVLPEQYRTRK